MSTKCSVAYGEGFHLYRECFDDDNIWLELEGVEYEASRGAVTVAIPLAIWEVIRKRGEVSPVDDARTDDQIRADVEADVRERRRRVEAAGDGPGAASEELYGLLDYGPSDRPIEDQVADGVKATIAARDKARALRERIAALEAEQRQP